MKNHSLANARSFVGYRPHPHKPMKNHSFVPLQRPSHHSWATAHTRTSAEEFTRSLPLAHSWATAHTRHSRLRCATGRWREYHRALLPCGLPAARAGRLAPSRLVGILPVPLALRPVATPPADGVLSSHPLAQPPALATPCSLKVAGESGSGYSRFLSHPLRTSVMS